MESDGRVTLEEMFMVARSAKLTSEELHLWTLYRSYQQRDGRGAFPGDDLLASHMNRSQRSVQDYRASLLEKRYLRRELRGPRPAHFWAVVPAEGSQSTAKQSGESLEAGCETTPEASQPTANHRIESQKASQKASQSAAPPYRENGENGELTAHTSERDEGGAKADHEWPIPDEAVQAGYPEEFEAAWHLYPDRGDATNPKKAAYRQWRARACNGSNPDELLRGTVGYHRACRDNGNLGTRFVMQASKFWGRDEYFREYVAEDGARPVQACGTVAALDAIEAAGRSAA